MPNAFIPAHPYPHGLCGHPTLVEMELTDACNAHCTFCPRHLFKQPQIMAMETFDHTLSRCVEGGIRAVKLVGIGEPTLHPQALAIMESLKSAGMEVLLNTNGSRLGRLGVNAVLERVDEVIFSLHSLNPEEHRTIFGIDFHAEAMENLDALLAANVRFGRRITLYVVLTRINLGAVEKLVAAYGNCVHIRSSGCSNRGVDDFNVGIKDDDINLAHNHYPPITDTSPYCYYADAAVVIDSRGRYRLCSNDAKRTLDLGTVASCSIANAFASLSERMREGGFLAFCRSCDNYQSTFGELTPPVLETLA